MSQPLLAGAAAVEITPRDAQFLYGYPHVRRFSTGVHDPLFSSALYLDDGATPVMFIANDILAFHPASIRRIRRRIERTTSLPGSRVMITATHTHSAPKSLDHLSTEADPAVPPADPAYVAFLEDRVVDAARSAVDAARPAELGLAVANATGIGTNRRDPLGPADLSVPVLMVRTADGSRPVACMWVCCMHPTVLHEDSTLVSADFPGLARQYLRQSPLGPDCPILHHAGPCGNQSPRHVTRGNTFAEAQRLGEILGRAVERALADIDYTSDVRLDCRSAAVSPPRRRMPPLADAERNRQAAVARLEHLRRSGAPRQEVRTAECDWFGAEETVVLARAEADGQLDAVVAEVLPAEVQLIGVGPWRFVGWPAETFVEYGLAVKRAAPDTFVIELANGELQGYVVTPEAAAEGGYEASNALFTPEAGMLFVDTTRQLLRKRATTPDAP